MSSPGVTKALTKFFLATCVLAGLVFLCFTDINGGLKGVLIVLIVILAFPITLLIGVDASKAIKRATDTGKSTRLVGRLLALPQAIIGVVLIAFSVIYPIFAIHDLLARSAGKAPVFVPIAGLVVAALGFVVGIHYVRDGVGFGTRKH